MKTTKPSSRLWRPSLRKLWLCCFQFVFQGCILSWWPWQHGVCKNFSEERRYVRSVVLGGTQLAGRTGHPGQLVGTAANRTTHLGQGTTVTFFRWFCLVYLSARSVCKLNTYPERWWCFTRSSALSPLTLLPFSSVRSTWCFSKIAKSLQLLLARM